MKFVLAFYRDIEESSATSACYAPRVPRVRVLLSPRRWSRARKCSEGPDYLQSEEVKSAFNYALKSANRFSNQL